jgi:hypothetical protein
MGGQLIESEMRNTGRQPKLKKPVLKGTKYLLLKNLREPQTGAKAQVGGAPESQSKP